MRLLQRNGGAESGARPNSMLISVSDSGAGIAAEYHQEIFEEFVRVDPSSSGMGLGLAITKRLIQAHRGKVWVNSEVGRGSYIFILIAHEYGVDERYCWSDNAPPGKIRTNNGRQRKNSSGG